MPEAAATAAPPLEPPEVMSALQGFKVLPCSGFSVNHRKEKGGTFVRPRKRKPAERKYRAGAPQVGHHGAVRGRDAVGESGNAVRRRLARNVDVELDRDGDAMKASKRLRCAGLQRIGLARHLQGVSAVRVDDGVEPGIHGIDAVVKGLRHFHAGDGAVADTGSDVRRSPPPHLTGH